MEWLVFTIEIYSCTVKGSPLESTLSQWETQFNWLSESKAPLLLF